MLSMGSGLPGALPQWLLPGHAPKKKKKRPRASEQPVPASRRQAVSHSAGLANERSKAQHAQQPKLQHAQQPRAQRAQQPEAQPAQQPKAQHAQQPRAQHAQQPLQQPARLHSLQAGESLAGPQQAVPAPQTGTTGCLSDEIVNSTRQSLILGKDSGQLSTVVKHLSVLQARQHMAAAAVADQRLAIRHQPGKAVVLHLRVKSERRKHVNRYMKSTASERCGQCRTCLKPSLKKACLVLRAKMKAASLMAACLEQAPTAPSAV